VRVYGGDWIEFIAELEKRLDAKPQPAATLIKKKPKG
jgi:hypothetical protein